MAGGLVALMSVVDMALVRPTWLIAVPRVFNRIYNACFVRYFDDMRIGFFGFSLKGIEAVILRHRIG